MKRKKELMQYIRNNRIVSGKVRNTDGLSTDMGKVKQSEDESKKKTELEIKR